MTLRINRLACTAAAAVATAAIAIGAAPAQAGSYTVWSCRDALGSPISTAAWTADTAAGKPGDAVATDNCATGGAFDIALATGRSFAAPTAATLTFTPPAGTTIDSYTLWRALAVAPPQDGLSFRFAAVERETALDSSSVDYGCATSAALCYVAGNPANPFDPANETTRNNVDLRSLQLRAECTSEGCDQASGIAARVRLFRSAIAIDDPVPPAAPLLGGSAVLPGPVGDTVSLTVDSTDTGGGVAQMTATLDGDPATTQTLISQSASCHEPYTIAQPCPAEAERAFIFAGGALANGPHSISGRIVDAAGNVTHFGPVTFTVARIHETVAGNGAPAVNTPVLRFDRRVFTHRRGRAARVTGTLRTASGQPIAGATLGATSVDLGVDDATVQALPAVVTDAAGKFSVESARDGAQRLRLTFAPQAGAASTATGYAVARTRLALTLRPSRRHLRRDQSVTLSGRLIGAGASAKGVSLNIEAVVDGRWRAVGSTTTHRRGRFAWKYRFVRVTRRTSFKFRAVAHRTPGWPWPAAKSATRRVRVDG